MKRIEVISLDRIGLVGEISNVIRRLNINKEDVVGNAFNFGTGIATDIETVVNKIKAIMKCEDIPSVVQQSDVSEILIQQLDAAKAYERLGWKAEYSLDKGLSETIGWYKNVYFKLN